MARTVALLREGHPVFCAVLGKADQTSKLSRCTTCGHEVGWVQNKAGKWYLANAQKSQNEESDRRYIASFWLHKCSEFQEVK